MNRKQQALKEFSDARAEFKAEVSIALREAFPSFLGLWLMMLWVCVLGWVGLW